MAKREKEGDIWYSHKVTDSTSGEVLYCHGYASPSSPGFYIASTPVANINDVGYDNSNSHDHKPSPKLDLDELNQALFG